MKLIGACQPRSGTMSLMTAVERMGGRCYHMKTVLENTLEGRGDLYTWFRIAELEPFDERRLRLLEQLLSGYDACVDSPACYVFEELMHIFPNARVALTKRDFSKWLVSVCRTVLRPYRFAKRPGVRACMMVLDLLWKIPVVGRIGIVGKMAAFPPAVALRPYLDEHGKPLDFYDPGNRQTLRSRFERYTRSVEEAVPPGELIVLEAPYETAYRALGPVFGADVDDDWQWPHVNDEADVNRSLDVVMVLLVAVPVLVVAGTVAMLVLFVSDPRLAAMVSLATLAALLGVKAFLKLLIARVGRKDRAIRRRRPSHH